MLKLSDVVHTRSIPLKQVSGGSFAVSDAPEERPRNEPKKQKKEGKDAKVIPFPSKDQLIKESSEKNGSPPEVSLNTSVLVSPQEFLASEEILSQLEVAREMKEFSQKQRAIEEYRQGQNTHIVRSKNEEGKTEVRFAKTKGVLIDRKLA